MISIQNQFYLNNLQLINILFFSYKITYIFLSVKIGKNTLLEKSQVLYNSALKKKEKMESGHAQIQKNLSRVLPKPRDSISPSITISTLELIQTFLPSPFSKQELLLSSVYPKCRSYDSPSFELSLSSALFFSYFEALVGKTDCPISSIPTPGTFSFPNSLAKNPPSFSNISSSDWEKLIGDVHDLRGETIKDVIKNNSLTLQAILKVMYPSKIPASSIMTTTPPGKIIEKIETILPGCNILLYDEEKLIHRHPRAHRTAYSFTFSILIFKTKCLALYKGEQATIPKVKIASLPRANIHQKPEMIFEKVLKKMGKKQEVLNTLLSHYSKCLKEIKNQDEEASMFRNEIDNISQIQSSRKSVQKEYDEQILLNDLMNVLLKNPLIEPKDIEPEDSAVYKAIKYIAAFENSQIVPFSQPYLITTPNSYCCFCRTKGIEVVDRYCTCDPGCHFFICLPCLKKSRQGENSNYPSCCSQCYHPIDTKALQEVLLKK